MLSALRSGIFVTLARMRAYSVLLLIAYGVSLIALLATATGNLDFASRPLGTDFINVYAAGTMANEGRAGQAYDYALHHEVEKKLMHFDGLGYWGWHYPPPFLMVAALLATLPYLLSLVLYQATTLAAYLLTVQRIAGRADAWLPALAFPAVFVNITHGHNGFITAALLGGALLLLDRRPLLAGALIGCLVYKPQFAMLLPLVLVVTGRWRTIAGAAASSLGLIFLCWVFYGSGIFVDFWHSIPLTQRVALDGIAGFYKLQSLYAALRLFGVSLGFASALQTVLAIGLAFALVVLWRSAAAYELKASALLIACALATPYVFDYDLVVLAPAIAFFAAYGLREGFGPWELTAIAALWLLPLVGRPFAQLTNIALAPWVMLAAFTVIAHRAGTIAQMREGLVALRQRLAHVAAR